LLTVKLAAKALEGLFYLSQTVKDYEEIGYQDKIAPTVVKGILSYHKWALQDAKLDKLKTLPALFVRSYPPGFSGGDVDEDSNDDESRDMDEYEPMDIDGDEGKKKDFDETTDEDGLTNRRRQWRFTQAVSRDLKRRLLRMGQDWRDYLYNDELEDYIVPPPTLYAFAVVQHIVMLVSHDSSSRKNPVVVIDHIRLNNRGHWLWNALSIAIPIQMARKAVCRTMDPNGIMENIPIEEDDPDL
jgi:hypothetical protein